MGQRPLRLVAQTLDRIERNLYTATMSNLSSSNRDPSFPQFPMRVVVRRTGLNPSLLRAWERRYAAVGPGRSEGGQRLYSESDVRRLGLLRAVVDAGHNIGRVAGLDEGDLIDLLDGMVSRAVLNDGGRAPGTGVASAGEASGDVRADGPRLKAWASTTAPAQSDFGGLAQGHAEAFLRDALQAIHEMEPRSLDAVLNRASLTLGPTVLVEGMLVPLLTRIGALWREGDMQPALEHVASGIVRRFLYGLIERLSPPAGAPVMVVGTPAGQRHEFGAQLAAVVGAGSGWDVLLLGADLPAGEIALAAKRKGAGVVALSALHPIDDPALLDELLSLRGLLESGVHLWVGGPAATAIGDELVAGGVEVLLSLASLRDRAASLRDRF